MAPIAKACPTFSGALIVADALGNMASSQSLSTSFILAFLSCLMEGCGQAGFHLNKLEGVGVQEIDTIKQSWISQYNFNVHICTENE